MRFILRLTVPCFVGAVLLASSACNWTMSGNDAARTNDNSPETTLTSASVSGLHPRWSVPGGSASHQLAATAATVFVVEDVVDAANQPNGFRLRALSTSTGSELWSFPLSVWPRTSAPSAPAIAGSLVIVGGLNGVWALDATTGTPRWATTLSRTPAGDPLVVGSTVYIGNSALDANTGAVLWSTPDPSDQIDAVAGGLAFLRSHVSTCAAGQSVVALDAATGQQQWSTNLGTGRNAFSPMVIGSTLTLSILTCNGGLGSGGVEALDPQTGAVRWTLANAGWTLGSSAGQIFSPGLTARATNDGSLRWSQPTDCGTAPGPPFGNSATAGTVVFSTAPGQLCATDVSTGTSLGHWPVATGGPIAAANGCVFVEGGPTTSPTVTAMCVDA